MNSLILALILYAPSSARDAETDAWDAAMALKKGSEFVAAAAAFEAFHASFPQSTHGASALVEAGVCWFSDGRAKQVLHRTTPAAKQSFDKGLLAFERVTSESSAEPASSRAQCMIGSTHLFLGDLESAEADYGAVLDTFKLDPAYVGKALERRAYTRRHLLRTADARADMQRWVEQYGAPEDTLAAVKKQLELTAKLDRPAPPYEAGIWVQGEPASIESFMGQVVGLYFFATWCPNCEKEQPFVLDLEHRFAPRGLQLIGVVDHSQGQTVETVREFAAKEGIHFPILMDNGATAASYGATVIPFLALIDAEGRLRWSDNPGGLVDWTLEALLDPKK